METFYGIVVRKEFDGTYWYDYLRLYLAIETSYCVQIINTVVFDKALKSTIQKFLDGSQVVFKGEYVTNPFGKFFKLVDIELKDFNNCRECGVPLFRKSCYECISNEPAQVLRGTRNVVFKSAKENTVKLIFTKDTDTLGYTCFNQSPFYKVCKSLEVNDEVVLEGWRSKITHTTLKDIFKINNQPLNIPM